MDYKYSIESLKRELGVLIDRKREIEHSHSMGVLSPESYQTLKDVYEGRFDELSSLIKELETRPKVDIHSTPGMINTISYCGKILPFKIEELEQFMFLKQSNKLSPFLLEGFKKVLRDLYLEQGANALRQLGIEVSFSDSRGYYIEVNLDLVEDSEEFKIDEHGH